MKNDLLLSISDIQRLGAEMGGVFLKNDLESLIPSRDGASLYRIIQTLESGGYISRFSKGIYILPNFEPFILSARINPDAYISMGTVLAQNGLIGSVPAKVLTAVKTGKSRDYNSNEISIKHFSISPHLYFGFKKVNGIKLADNEKAFLDTLFFITKGYKPFFNPTSDLDLKQLDRKRLSSYLKKYKNPKFITYCERIIYG